MIERHGPEVQPTASTSYGSNASSQPKTERDEDVTRKRNRTRVSCMECRRLKLKCDRVWPCSTCRKRGLADLCPDKASKPPGRAAKLHADLDTLSSRVKELTSIIRSLGASDQLPPPLQLHYTSSSAARKAAQTEGDKEAEGQEAEHEPVIEEETPGEEDRATDLAQILDGVGSLSIGDDGRVRYLGASAASAYFIKEEEGEETVAKEQVPTASPPPQLSRYPFVQLANIYPKDPELARLRGFLPPIEELERLSVNYWQYLSFQFQPLEEEVYWRDYLPAAVMPSHDSQGSKLAVVFMILSLGSLMDPRAPSTPNVNAHHYFTLAMTTLSASRFLSHNTIAGVQCIQLAANYLLNSHNFAEGAESYWPILGMGLRMLVSMGLHRDGSKWGLPDEEVDRRRWVFFELVTLDRMQAFISGRPYMISPQHCDTQMPTDAEPYHTEKWKLGNFIAHVIDTAFSIEPPSYAVILKLDDELRSMFRESPKQLRSGALPSNAFEETPNGPPELPLLPQPVGSSLKYSLRQHILDMMFSQVFFYTHLPAFRQALALYSSEPLSSPFVASVAVVSLETGVYMLALAKSWTSLQPVLAPRYWHLYFHSFAASVAQASIVIKSPHSVLTRHAWGQLELAIEIFETAATGGAPVSTFVPRLKALREKAYTSLVNAQSVPHGIDDETDANLSILGPTTRLHQRSRKLREDTNSPQFSSPPAAPTPASNASTCIPPQSVSEPARVRVENEYSPFDSPVLLHTRPSVSTLPSAVPPFPAPEVPIPLLSVTDNLASPDFTLSSLADPMPGLGFSSFATAFAQPNAAWPNGEPNLSPLAALDAAAGGSFPTDENWIWGNGASNLAHEQPPVTLQAQLRAQAQVQAHIQMRQWMQQQQQHNSQHFSPDHQDPSVS